MRRGGLLQAVLIAPTASGTPAPTSRAASGKTEPFRNLKISDVADRTGRHVVDALLDIAVADRLKTEFYLTPPNTSLKYLREIVDDPWVLFGVSDGGAHTKFSTAGCCGSAPRRT